MIIAFLFRLISSVDAVIVLFVMLVRLLFVVLGRAVTGVSQQVSHVLVSTVIK